LSARRAGGRLIQFVAVIAAIIAVPS